MRTKRTQPQETVLLRTLKREDIISYAELCEKSGYKEEALKIYSRKGEFYHAAELAVELKKYDLARRYIKRAIENAQESVRNAESNAARVSMDPEGRGLLGAAYGVFGSQDRLKELRDKVSRLEARMVGR